MPTFVCAPHIPVADIIKLHNIHYHFYADDMYVTFKTDSCEDLSSLELTLGVLTVG